MTASGLSLDWFIGQLHPLRPGFWLLLSFVWGGLTLATARFLSNQLTGRLRLGRWVLTPYLGLLVGGLSPRLLGLTDLDWAAGLALGVEMIFAVWLLLVLVRVSLHSHETAEKIQRSRPLLAQLIWTGGQEFHWVFLRGAVWEMLLALPNPPALSGYWAVWLAAALSIPGIFVHYRQTSQRIVATVLLCSTAILFLYTRNFYLCWALHTSAAWLLDQNDSNVNEKRESVAGTEEVVATERTPAQSSMQKVQR